MEKYKPQYLGAVLPDQPKIKKFLDTQYEQFNDIYDACKDSSSGIVEISNITPDDSTLLKVKLNVTTNNDLDKISATIKTNSELSNKVAIIDTVISAVDNVSVDQLE